MRKLAFLAVLFAFALTAGEAVPIDSNSKSESAKVRSLLVYQTRLFNEARWRPMYRTYAPRVRSRCSYSRFVQEAKQFRALVGGPIALRNIRVRVAGRRASSTYQMVSGGKVIGGMTAKRPDSFIQIQGRWFDDLDSGSPCSNASAAPAAL